MRKIRTNEELLEIASKYTTRNAWRKGDPNSYAAARMGRHGDLDSFCTHMQQVHTTWTRDKIQTIANKYETRNAWQVGDPNSHAAASVGRHGDLDSFCTHMIVTKTSWTRDKIQTIGNKYETGNAWRKGDPKSYAAARKGRYGDLDSFCTHMIVTKTSWTRDKIQTIAKKYESRSAWKVGNPKSYSATRKGRHGDLDSFCTHMHKLHNFTSYHHMMSTEESRSAAKVLSSCVTYFIKIKLPCGQVTFKIGYSHTFTGRVKSFASENVEVLEVLDIVQHTNQFDAMSYEHECQNHNDALGFNAGLTKDQKFGGYTECYNQLEHKGVTYTV